jgi:Nucleoside-diphosphate-sugar epimerases
MKLLITGGCGFVGSNLAAHALKLKYDVTVYDNLSRVGSYDNYLWLKSLGLNKFIHGDIRNRNDVNTLIKSGFDAVFHLAGQVAMTTSMENPCKDFEINALGSFNLLDAVRKYCRACCIIYSSTNKVYGDLEQFTYTETNSRYICNEKPDGFDELVSLDFHSPYGCSKGAADQYMLDFHRIFGLKTVVFRHSSMYGGRQYATYDQGWIGWFCQKAMEQKANPKSEPFTISGTGKQVRDILHASDIVSLYFSSLDKIDTLQGNAFNIGGSMEQSLSILELFSFFKDILDVKLNYVQIPARISDQRVFVADISKIQRYTGWKPLVSSRDGITDMLGWINPKK